MLFAKQNRTIEEYILFLLKEGPLKITEVIEKIKRLRPKTTKQGVYYIIRLLKKAEVLVTHKKMVSLNTVWLKKLAAFVSLAENSYLESDNYGGGIRQLKNGDKIQYNFKNSLLTDVFWNHIIFQIEAVTANEPFIAYNPHSWFFLAHPDNEIQVRDLFVSNKRQYLVMAGHKNTLDLSVKQYFDNKLSQYYAQEKALFKKENYYLNIIGNFIVEVWIDQKIEKEIDKFYILYKECGEIEKDKFRQILKDRGKTKLVISRDHNKAEKLKKQLLKPFWLLKHVSSP